MRRVARAPEGALVTVFESHPSEHPPRSEHLYMLASSQQAPRVGIRLYAPTYAREKSLVKGKRCGGRREFARIGEYGNRSFKRLFVVAEAQHALPRVCY